MLPFHDKKLNRIFRFVLENVWSSFKVKELQILTISDPLHKDKIPTFLPFLLVATWEIVSFFD